MLYWGGGGHGAEPGLPDELLAMQVERVLLIVAEHLEHDGLGLDVLDERLGHLHRDLFWGRGESSGQQGLRHLCT